MMIKKNINSGTNLKHLKSNTSELNILFTKVATLEKCWSICRS